MEQRIEEIGARLQFNRVKYLGVDLARDALEVAPACHYSLGGVRINEHAQTSVPGLFAAGEVSGNVHGANRISGNALAETQVFGRRAGESASRWARESQAFPDLDPRQVEEAVHHLENLREKKREPLRPVTLRRRIQGIMEEKVSLSRSEGSLRQALESLRVLGEEELPRMQVEGSPVFNYELQDAVEVGFMTQVAELVIRASLLRTESRGHHCRSDFPVQDAGWLKHTLLQKKEGEILCTSVPVIRLS